jgi:uncharacterized protein YqeY
MAKSNETLYAHLQQVRTEALKLKDSFSFTKLGTVLGEAKQLATKKENRDPTDEEVIGIVKKGLEGIAEMLEHEKDNLKRGTLLAERQLLQTFMPTQLSETEIKVIIENAAMDSIGKIMAIFKNNFAGKYDGKLVSKLAEEFLSSK